MPGAHSSQSTANPPKLTVALLASATAVTASIVVTQPRANTVAAQLPEITRQVTLTAATDPISLIEGLLALPPAVAQELLGGLRPSAAAQPAAENVSHVQRNSATAVAPSISPAVPSPQNLIGGLGTVLSSAVSMVANDVAYVANLPLAVAVPVVLPIVLGFPYSLNPQFIAGVLTTNLPFAVSYALANTVNEIVSQAGQFVSSLGGLVSAAATPPAAASVPKVQTNLVKVSQSTAALSAPNSTADSTPGKKGPDKKSDKKSDTADATLKADSSKTKSDKGGKHRKPSESGQATNGQPGAGAGTTGETKGNNGSGDRHGSKHASDTSSSNNHGTGDGQGNAGSRGGSGGHRGAK